MSYQEWNETVAKEEEFIYTLNAVTNSEAVMKQKTLTDKPRVGTMGHQGDIFYSKVKADDSEITEQDFQKALQCGAKQIPLKDLTSSMSTLFYSEVTGHAHAIEGNDYEIWKLDNPVQGSIIGGIPEAANDAINVFLINAKADINLKQVDTKTKELLLPTDGHYTHILPKGFYEVRTQVVKTKTAYKGLLENDPDQSSELLFRPVVD